MPSFTEVERSRIREELLEVGRELFTTRGLRKTSMDDLTRQVGIATSSFYACLESKEAL